VGERIVLNYGDPEEERLEVIGLVKDFNVESLHSGVKPLVFYYYLPDITLDYIAVRIQPGNPAKALAEVEKAWKKFEPENPFVYSFLERDFEQQFLSEQRLSKLFGVFTGLTVGIALLGLTGLVSFMAEQRTKEIGIRKVLGASVTGIIVLFSRDFTRLALMALVVAIPASYFVVDAWLENFAYRIDIHPIVFVGCSLLSLLLMWITVSALSMRVAKLDPAKTLKTE
jgi:putative ABC transport system permease protein